MSSINPLLIQDLPIILFLFEYPIRFIINKSSLIFRSILVYNNSLSFPFILFHYSLVNRSLSLMTNAITVLHVIEELTYLLKQRRLILLTGFVCFVITFITFTLSITFTTLFIVCFILQLRKSLYSKSVEFSFNKVTFICVTKHIS